MNNHHAIVVNNDRAVISTVCRALHAVGFDADVAEDASSALDLIDRQDYDLIFLDQDPSLNPEILLDAAGRRYPRCKTILVSKEAPAESVQELEQNDFIQNLIARKVGIIAHLPPLNVPELIATVAKLSSGDIFGLDKYFPWGVRIERRAVSDSLHKQDHIDEVLAFARQFMPRDRTISVLNVVADEFLTNALYNAPRDKRGRQKYIGLSRRERVVLEPHETATLSFACDGRMLGISVSDPFGALDRQHIVTYLQRCFARRGRRKLQEGGRSGGAGLGLYMSFNFIENFIINLEKNSRTEIIGLIDLQSSRPSRRQTAKSFHVFLKEGR